jgi:Immune inhibitor A-like, MAM domain
MNPSRRTASLSLALLLTACAGGNEQTPPEDDGSGAGGTGGMATGGMAEGGMAMGGAAAGGSADGGGSTGPCDIDCSSIQTPDCSEAVCNEGQHQGTIGECVVVSVADGNSCDDGVFCTVDDSCVAGVCTGGPPNDCGMPAGQCEQVVCDEANATCSAAPDGDGTPCSDPNNLCNVNTTCQAGVCSGGTTNDCFFAPVPDDCHVAVCNPTNGICEPVIGNDGQSCTDQMDLCTVNKICTAGSCQGGTATDCSALDIGCQIGVCDVATGQCGGQAVPMGGTCFDGVGPCESGSCDANGNCVATPVANGGACDDFSICTLNDICTGGVCAGTVDPMCSTYFEANFEVCPPPGWTLNAEWECGAPTNVGPMSPNTGTGLLGTDLDATYDNNQPYATAYAQTPPIGLGPAVAPMLTYSHYVDTEGSVYDGYNIKVSTDGGMTWSILTTVNPPYNLTIGGESAYGGHINAWVPVTADLTAYQGQTIILRWSFRSDGSVLYPGVYIDDIQIN